MHHPPECARLLVALHLLDFCHHHLHGCGVFQLNRLVGAFQEWQQRAFETLAQRQINFGVDCRNLLRHRKVRANGQVWEKQIGRMDSFSAADLQQRLIVREQTHRLMAAASQYFIQVFDQCLIGVADNLHMLLVQFGLP